MSIVTSGSIELNGTTPVLVKIPSQKFNSPVHLRGLSREMDGKPDLGQNIPGVGFELKSSSDKDKGIIIYFDVYEVADIKKRK